MPSYVTPKKNTAYVFYVSLVSQANTKIMQANPTLAAGDVKVAVDDAAPANLATLPTVDGDFTKRIKVSLSTSEMNGDNITVIFSDAAGSEWCDLTVNIQTTAGQIDDIPTTAEFEARTLPSADYVVVTDTIAGVTTATNLTNAPTNGDLTATMKASVNTEADTALTDYDPPTKTEMDTAHSTTDGLITTVDTVVDGIQTDLDNATDGLGALKALIDALNDISTGDVNAQVSDVLKIDTISEQAQGIPPTTPTFEQAVMYLYMALTKAVDVDATLKEFYNNAGTVVWKKTLSDDGTNYNEAKGASGP